MIQGRDQAGQGPTALRRQDDATVVRVTTGQNDKIADVKGKDATSVGGGLEQLSLVTSISGYPVVRSARHVVAARDQGLLKRLSGRVGVEV